MKKISYSSNENYPGDFDKLVVIVVTIEERLLAENLKGVEHQRFTTMAKRYDVDL